MSGRTADVYCQWIRRYLAFAAAARGGWVPPEQLGTADVEAFLNHLVGQRRLAASTQNQALNALVFLYRHVLADAIARDHLGKFELLRSTRPARLPTVLSVAEVARVLGAIAPECIFRLMAELLYGTGLRQERQPAEDQQGDHDRVERFMLKGESPALQSLSRRRVAELLPDRCDPRSP